MGHRETHICIKAYKNFSVRWYALERCVFSDHFFDERRGRLRLPVRIVAWVIWARPFVFGKRRTIAANDANGSYELFQQLSSY